MKARMEPRFRCSSCVTRIRSLTGQRPQFSMVSGYLNLSGGKLHINVVCVLNRIWRFHHLDQPILQRLNVDVPAKVWCSVSSPQYQRRRRIRRRVASRWHKRAQSTVQPPFDLHCADIFVLRSIALMILLRQRECTTRPALCLF